MEVSLCGAHEWRDSGGGGGRRPSTMVKVRVVFPLVPSAEDPFRLAPQLPWQPKIMGYSRFFFFFFFTVAQDHM